MKIPLALFIPTWAAVWSWTKEQQDEGMSSIPLTLHQPVWVTIPGPQSQCLMAYVRDNSHTLQQIEFYFQISVQRWGKMHRRTFWRLHVTSQLIILKIWRLCHSLILFFFFICCEQKRIPKGWNVLTNKLIYFHSVQINIPVRPHSPKKKTKKLQTFWYKVWKMVGFYGVESVTAQRRKLPWSKRRNWCWTRRKMLNQPHSCHKQWGKATQHLVLFILITSTTTLLIEHMRIN